MAQLWCHKRLHSALARVGLDAPHALVAVADRTVGVRDSESEFFLSLDDCGSAKAAGEYADLLAGVRGGSIQAKRTRLR